MTGREAQSSRFKKPDGLRVLIAGGGTGGHVIPALAIARELRDAHAAEVRFVGTARGLETRLVPESGFHLDLVRSGQLKNVSLATRLRTAIDLPLGVVECLRLLREFRPQVVVGVGGYASGPAMLAALLLRLPTLAFEPNAVPGLANRLVGRWVSAAAVNFQQTQRYFRHARVTGIPVRADFFAVAPKSAAEPPRLLVFGGSQGARVFNEAMPKIAQRLLEQFANLEIVHQAGARHADSTAHAYAHAGFLGQQLEQRVRVQPYLDQMPREFAAADLLLCRSGASTMAELGATGKASLLVPFALAADDHQRRNAEIFLKAGAARMLIEAELAEPDRLLDELSRLLADPQALRAMGERAHSLARPDAARQIAAMVVELARMS
jgi:UDP-N-acetylglucosamine--N-acetylmuramyl-(pentapeptide) pyrophosphoryl-undecaprenol N-acetylglucosamine transferase